VRRGPGVAAAIVMIAVGAAAPAVARRVKAGADRRQLRCASWLSSITVRPISA